MNRKPSSLVIEACGLGHRYAGSPALQDLELGIEAGGPVGLVGPNGAGKTTLFALLGGYIRPQNGSLSVLGCSPGDPALCGRVSILPQDAPLKTGIAVGNQLRLLARLQGLDRSAAGKAVEEVLEILVIGDLAGRHPMQLSHGQYKRVAIAQCLLGEPELILLDEPTAGLDPVATQAVHKVIREFRREATLVISSHNLDEIGHLCERVVLLDRGRLVRYCPMEDLLESGGHLSVRLMAAADDEVTALLRAIDGVMDIQPLDNGRHEFLIHYNRADADAFQLEVMQALSAAGIGVSGFNRGKDLARQVVDLVSESN